MRTPRLACSLCLALATACGAPFRRVSPDEAMKAALSWPAAVGWEAAGDEALALLADYVRVPTPNPPGNESAGAAYLASVLARDGIESEIFEHAPGRGSLVARLGGNGSAPPLCLLSHIDVATADPGEWTHPADVSSGALRDGYLWGRGALDMKSLGVMQLETFLLLHRLEVPLRRDVVLLAMADEEVGNQGVQALVREHWDRIGCSHALNEGGVGLVDPFFPDQTLYTISVGEKGTLWVKMTAHARSGHGSIDRPGEAVDLLLAAIARLRRRAPEPAVPGVLYQLLGEAGAQGGGVTGFVLGHPALVDTLAVGKLMEHPAMRAAMTDTVHLTGLSTPAGEPNVVPAEASAILDCRLLPGTEPRAVLAELRHLVGPDLAVTFEVLRERPGNESPVDDPLYEALVRHALAGQPNAVAGPMISVGTTDSVFLRPLGVRAYGFLPVALTEEEVERTHGPDERISIDGFKRGLAVLFGAVAEFVAAAEYTQ